MSVAIAQRPPSSCASCRTDVMDLKRTARQLGIDDVTVLAKARELLSLAAVRVAGGLGQGEVCKAAVCLELAVNVVGTPVDGLTKDHFIKAGCCSAKVYKTTFQALQQVLGAARAVDLQQLVLKYGCASVRQSVMRVLSLYKDRFLLKLPDADRAKANFNRPVFLAVAFVLVARKNKIKVDQRELLEDMSVPLEDFANISASMYELCFDIVGVEKTKKKASTRKTNTAVLDNHREHDEEEEGTATAEPLAECSVPESDANASTALDRSMKRMSKKEQQKADYDEWKLLVLGTSGKGTAAAKENSLGKTVGGASESAHSGAKHTEKTDSDPRGNKKLKQVKLSFGS